MEREGVRVGGTWKDQGRLARSLVLGCPAKLMIVRKLTSMKPPTPPRAHALSYSFSLSLSTFSQIAIYLAVHVQGEENDALSAIRSAMQVVACCTQASHQEYGRLPA